MRATRYRNISTGMKVDKQALPERIEVHNGIHFAMFGRHNGHIYINENGLQRTYSIKHLKLGDYYMKVNEERWVVIKPTDFPDFKRTIIL